MSNEAGDKNIWIDREGQIRSPGARARAGGKKNPSGVQSQDRDTGARAGIPGFGNTSRNVQVPYGSLISDQ